MKKFRKADDVVILTGRDKGKRGTILRVLDDQRALVDSVNIVKKHTRPNPNKGETGGIIEKESPIRLSNLGMYNPNSKEPDRVGFKFLEDGRKVRVFRSDGEMIDVG